MSAFTRFYGFLVVKACQSIGSENTVCLAFLALSVFIYASFYGLGLILDVWLHTDMLMRILLILGFSIRYVIKLPSEIQAMELGAARLNAALSKLQ
jgi:hypothetical protein